MFKTVIVEKLVYGGYGLCRSDEGIVFVPGTLPGEHIRILPEKKKQGFITASLLETIKRSPQRRTPQCKWAGICGGCDWMHIRYEAQLELKKEIFLDCIKRIGRINDKIKPQIYSSPELNYRIRAQIKSNNMGQTGFFKKGTNQVVPIDNCLLLSQRLNELLRCKKVSDLANCNEISNLKVIEGELVVASDPLLPGITEKSTIMKIGTKHFKVHGGSFFQSNRFLMEKLGLWAKPFVGGKTCVDLYGGTGFFSVMLSSNFKQGVLIESVSDQVESACANFHNNGIAHFSAINLCAEKTGQIVKSSPDLLIVDPPRPGLTRKVREFISQLKPKQLLYISCNSSTQARDAGFFVNRAGYNIKETALFDLYPNTHHLETVILFEK